MRSALRLAAVGLVAWSAGRAALAQDYDREPVCYSTATPDNRFSQLAARLASGASRLEHEPHFGYLRSLLQELQISETSQVLVFSKTSLQRQRIAPRTPRSLFFNDDLYVGFCQQGDVLEISAVDPQLGAVFYTVDQRQTERPKIVRQNDNCLICHGSSQTKDVPGHLVRSVFADAAGMPILSAGTNRVDHTTPLARRWGGWYVSGTHGAQQHLGNLVIRGEMPEQVNNEAGQNVTDLADRFDRSKYLTPHSDIVALLVLEHQADAHNYLTRANFLTRQAAYDQQQLNRDLGESDDHVWPSTASRIKSACEPLVEYLLFSGEVPLSAPVRGTSGFAEQFASGGPRDHLGRSLRELDLERRLLKHPCSYLVYGPSFAALPAEAKTYVWRRLWEVLTGADASKKFAHLSADDRQAIVEILRDTVADLPDYWRA